jgi:hypothetical protein
MWPAGLPVAPRACWDREVGQPAVGRGWRDAIACPMGHGVAVLVAGYPGGLSAGGGAVVESNRISRQPSRMLDQNRETGARPVLITPR